MHQASSEHKSWSPAGSHEVMTTLLARRAREAPDVVCLDIEGEGPITHCELQDRSLRLASGLRSLGVGRGDAVAVLMENSASGVYTWFACSALGAIYVPLNTALHGSFLEHQLRTAQASVLVTEVDRLADVARIESDIVDTLGTVIVAGDGEFSPLPKLSTIAWASVSSGAAGDPVSVDESPSWHDPAVVLFTSGTTGPSKGAVLSHRYLLHMAEIYARNMRMESGDTFYSVFPLFHLSGSCVTILGPLVAGAKGVLDRTFSVTNYWRRVRETGASHALLLGATIQMLWSREPDDDEQANGLRVVLAQPLPAAMHRPFEERYGVAALSGYGLTEAGTVSLSDPDHPAPPGSAGLPLPGYEVVIVDDNDDPVSPGTPGEILIRPREPHIIFEGYVGNPEATLAVFRNMWLHTGDLGSIDESGYLWFVDRKKDYLRRRGENISSMEVEGAIARHPAVAAVAVIGVPSELSEDEVKACVVRTPGADLSERELLDHCIDALPYFAVPRFIEFVDDLPRTPSGKVQKVELRRLHDPAAVWDSQAAGIKVTRTSRFE
jgi:crotonobetaine/carnitine-CoA ligase